MIIVKKKLFKLKGLSHKINSYVCPHMDVTKVGGLPAWNTPLWAITESSYSDGLETSIYYMDSHSAEWTPYNITINWQKWCELLLYCRDYVTDPRGLISKKDFQKAMDSQKQYTTSEIQFLLSCSEADENEMINFEEFANRFQEPAKDIGFNVAVLLTNLSEHVPHDVRLQSFLELADCIINYFKPYLGKIEIMGAGKKIERIYFEINETNKAQWEMPQVKESKRQFIFDVVNEGGESEKMELFVNFCEDTIFEMQIAAQISEPEEEKVEDDDEDFGGAEGSGEGEDAENGSEPPEPTSAFGDFMNNVINFFKMFTYRNLRRQYRKVSTCIEKQAHAAYVNLCYWS